MIDTSPETACMIAGAAALTVLAHSYCVAPRAHHPYAAGPTPCSARAAATADAPPEGAISARAATAAAPAAEAAPAEAEAADDWAAGFAVDPDNQADFQTWAQGASKAADTVKAGGAKKRATPDAVVAQRDTVETTHFKSTGLSIPTLGRSMEATTPAPKVSHPECMLYMPESMADTLMESSPAA